jgi:Trp operon repressor
MANDLSPLHERWRELARLIVSEQDEEKQQEWLNLLVLSYNRNAPSVRFQLNQRLCGKGSRKSRGGALPKSVQYCTLFSARFNLVF